MKSKPFFFRIDLVALFDFATDEIGIKMTLLQFAKSLQQGQSEIPYIQNIIAETNDFIEKKKQAGRSGGLAKASTAKAKHSKPVAKRSKGYPEAVTETEDTKPLPEYSDEFISFWKAYPNKTAKGAAWTEWKKFKPTLADVLNALEWQTKTKKWEDGFILDPERYIKRRCWEDEPEKAAPKCTIAEWQ